MPDRQHGRHRFKLGKAQTVNPVRSLPARISFLVFGATLITSLLVTHISVNSADAFLRGKIEQNFPTILESAGRRLDLWYDQRLLELGVFSNSGILTENVPLLSLDQRSKRSQRARDEVEQYLGYVLDSFPQYDALFVLGPNSQRLLWVGSDFSLPDELLRGALSSATEPRLSRSVEAGTEVVQLVSTQLRGPGSKPSGTLHAVMLMDAVAQVLDADEVGEFGEVFLLDESRQYLVASPERLKTGTWTAPDLGTAGAASVLEYADHSGERVVGAARPVERFGWILAVEEPYNDAFAPVVSGFRRLLGINLGIVLLFALGAFRVARSIAEPIEALSESARRISEGEKAVEIEGSDRRDELGILTRTFKEMTSRLENNTRELESSQAETQAAVERMRGQNAELQRMNEILEQLSITDGLTKLHNHRYFQEHLSKEAKRAGRSGVSLSLILIDIDHFKMWNDRLGHSGGDDILRRIAEIMQQLTRGTDLLARYGGEEFALLLPATEIEGAVRLAEKIRSSIAETEFFIEPPSERQPVTVSIGVSVFNGNQREFFDEADEALYRAKHSGRDCVVTADPATAASSKKKKKRAKKS